MNRLTRQPDRRAGAFTLTEVLIALGILAIGITSVASLFPPAILLQRETVRDVLGQQNMRSLDALLRAKPLDGTQLFRFTDNLTAATNNRTAPDNITYNNVNGAAAARGAVLTGTPSPERWVVPDPEFDLFALAEIDSYNPAIPPNATYPIPNALTSVNTEFPDLRPATNYGTIGLQGDPAKVNYSRHQSMLAGWGELDRSYPSYVADPARRQLYVVPLIQRGLQASEFSSDWRVYGLLLERREADLEGLSQPIFPAIYPGFASVDPDAQNAIVCANPYDDPTYFPKVFRIPAVDNKLTEGGGTPALVANLDDNDILLLVPNTVTFADGSNGFLLRPGDMLLGDTGDILRVVGFPDAGNFNRIRVSVERRQSTAGLLSAERTLRAVWIGLRPTATADSPLRDVRILSQNVVRTLPSN